MCNFKSGVIFKNRVVLTQETNESHSSLLKMMDVEDNYMNAETKFIRAELIPKNGDKFSDVNEWNFRVDQDIVPEWYKEDPGKYEKLFVDAVTEYMKGKYSNICGYTWRVIRDGDLTYYFMDGSMKRMRFGDTNNYAKSDIREFLLGSDLLKDLKEHFGDRLVPVTLDLTSMDGLKDYGVLEGDLIAIPNIHTLLKFGDRIPLLNDPYWLATPNQTPTRDDSLCVRYVCHGGCLNCEWCGYDVLGVRPFLISKS